MRVVTVPAKEKFLFDLLKAVQDEKVILQTTEGQQFVLLSLEGWKGFDVGGSENFKREVKVTAENKELIAFLETRRSNGKRIPMEDVKRQLGLS